MVDAADRLKPKLAHAASPEVAVNLDRRLGDVVGLQSANREAMLKSELIPAGDDGDLGAGLRLAGGRRPAVDADHLRLIASAGVLYLGTQLSPISIWSMNFALMFALALGIDYALFVVFRFRQAHFGQKLSPVEAVASTMTRPAKQCSSRG